jgi:imidazolonepropionase-like amidohydrolase
VREGGQAAMDAILAVTPLNADALGLKDSIGTLAPPSRVVFPDRSW